MPKSSVVIMSIFSKASSQPTPSMATSPPKSKLSTMISLVPSLAGGYVVTYSVTNSTGVTSTRTKNFTVLVAHNVANGDFMIPSYGWNLDIPGGSATLNAAGGNAVITVSNPGNALRAIQLYQTNVLFSAGETYKLTLKASSATGYSIAAGYENVDGGYAMLNPGFQVMERMKRHKNT
ncbi:MAG: hypothetical protein MZU97_23110 [Bacillus subtilis]|nr:hypothetical protein [Bacillus subtilis]